MSKIQFFNNELKKMFNYSKCSLRVNYSKPLKTADVITKILLKLFISLINVNRDPINVWHIAGSMRNKLVGTQRLLRCNHFAKLVL